MDPQTHTWRDVKQERRYYSFEDEDESQVVVFLIVFIVNVEPERVPRHMI